MTNKIIRDFAKENSVRLWQIADACGMADGTFSRKLRHELPEDEQRRIIEQAKALIPSVSG